MCTYLQAVENAKVTECSGEIFTYTESSPSLVPVMNISRCTQKNPSIDDDLEEAIITQFMMFNEFIMKSSPDSSAAVKHAVSLCKIHDLSGMTSGNRFPRRGEAVAAIGRILSKTNALAGSLKFVVHNT